MNEKHKEVMMLMGLLALFGGVLIAGIIMICVYCIREQKVETEAR